MFIAALFKIAKIQKQLKYPKTNEWIKKMWINKDTQASMHTHNGKLLSHKKEETFANYSNMGEVGEHSVKQNKQKDKYGLMSLRCRV